MNWPNWLRAIFAAEEPLPVVRPRFVENPFIGQITIGQSSQPSYVRNFKKTPEQRSAEAKAGHIKRKATAAANKARAG